MSMQRAKELVARLRARLGVIASVSALVAALALLGYRTYEYRREAASESSAAQHPIVSQARMLVTSGQTAEALDLLRSAVQQNPTDTEVGLEYAAVLHLTENYPEAKAAISRVLEVRPDWPEALCLRGMTRRNTGDLDGGIEDLEAAVAGDPDKAPLLYALAHGLLMRSRSKQELATAPPADMDRAMELLERAVELAPNQPEYVGELAELYKIRDQWPGAIEGYLHLAELLPQSAEPLARASECYLNSGDAQNAADTARAALSRDPRHAPAHALLARALNKMPIESVDLDEYKRALRSWWDQSGRAFSTPALWLADVYVREDNLEDAEATLREAIEDEQERRHIPDGELHARLSGLLRDQGREQEAEEQMRIARRLHKQWDPIGALLNRIDAQPHNSRDDRLELAGRLHQLGWSHLALPYLQPLLEADPPDAEAQKLAQELRSANP